MFYFFMNFHFISGLIEFYQMSKPPKLDFTEAHINPFCPRGNRGGKRKPILLKPTTNWQTSAYPRLPIECNPMEILKTPKSILQYQYQLTKANLCLKQGNKLCVTKTMLKANDIKCDQNPVKQPEQSSTSSKHKFFYIGHWTSIT